MLNVALLWHMHQPCYVNPLTRTALMPWVRLHAVKGYLDMAAMAKRHPEIRLVFNLTPVLIQQIIDLTTGKTIDLWEEWTKRPAAELSPDQKRQLLENFFKANWDHLVRPSPRYHELLAKRGYDLSHISLDAIVPSFSKQDCLDLQVWFNLAWCGYAACAEFPELNELKIKGRNFSEEDKGVVLSVHHRILEGLLSRYRALAESGQIELSTTPFFHPISPLVYDSNVAHRAMPWATLPPRFHWPEDIKMQTELAVRQHERVFGKAPIGMWPSEGSVCPELIPIWQKLGFSWFATDEEVLFKSLAHESVQSVVRTQLHDAYEAAWEGTALRAIFRDRALSDFVGFSASRNRAREATSHIMQRLHEIVGATEGKTDPLMTIVLDGENAWEYFHDGGEEFLDRWYHALTAPSGWKMTTLGDYAALPISRHRLNHLHTGSWIRANFDIWIGDPEENRAWELLGETRSWWEKHRVTTSPEVAEQVWAEIHAAEGSDWFWWYGPDFQTDNDILFDELFRTHLQNVYLLCGINPPASLSQRICRPSGATNVQSPIGLIQPKLDGIQTNYFEWHEAGRYQPAQSRGSMFQGEGVIRSIYYGFDLEHFYLRLDGYPDLGRRTGLRLRVHIEDREPLEYDWSPATSTIAPSNERTTRISQVAYRRIVEICASFRELSFAAGQPVRFHISVARNDKEGQLVEMERHPVSEQLEFRVPDPLFAAANWSA